MILLPLTVAGQNSEQNTEIRSTDVSRCSQERFEEAQHLSRDVFRDGVYRERKLAKILAECPDAPWSSQVTEFLQTAREESAEHSFRVAKYYQDLYNSERTGGLKGAEARYQEIVEKYPEYSRLDLTLLNLGDAQAALGNYDDAWTSYQRLINEFPTSQLVKAAFKRLQTLETMRIQHPLFDPEMSPQQNPN